MLLNNGIIDCEGRAGPTGPMVTSCCLKPVSRVEGEGSSIAAGQQFGATLAPAVAQTNHLYKQSLYQQQQPQPQMGGQSNAICKQFETEQSGRPAKRPIESDQSDSRPGLELSSPSSETIKGGSLPSQQQQQQQWGQHQQQTQQALHQNYQQQATCETSNNGKGRDSNQESEANNQYDYETILTKILNEKKLALVSGSPDVAGFLCNVKHQAVNSGSKFNNV